MMALELPAILSMPPKLTPVLTDFNDFRYILIEGGRGSAKTQTIARILLYIGEQVNVRIVCGREQQNSIEESVYTILKDLIAEYDLAYDVFKHEIRHKWSGTTFKFKGFREQGSVNIKGLEGVDILWIDEAQAITKPTLDVIIPTIRKQKAKLIFTMNRYMRDDAVPEFLVGRGDCLHIQINYNENPFCPLNLKNEAELMKNKSERDFRHIWLGEPLATADDYLMNYDHLYRSYTIEPYGESYGYQRVMGIDFAAQGNDNCVATILDRKSNQHWKLAERIPWQEPDAMVSIGKIVDLIGRYKPDIIVLDVGGMGHVVFNRLQELNIKNLFRFDGATTDGVDTVHYVNARAEGYYILKDWFDNAFLCIDKNKDAEVIKQLEKIKMKWRSDGRRIIQAKVDMKKELLYSPDDADSLMMAVYGAVKFLGKHSNSTANQNPVKRVSGSARGAGAVRRTSGSNRGRGGRAHLGLCSHKQFKLRFPQSSPHKQGVLNGRYRQGSRFSFGCIQRAQGVKGRRCVGRPGGRQGQDRPRVPVCDPGRRYG